jgi:hypothetical protein
MDQSSLLGGREAMTTLRKKWGWRFSLVALLPLAGCSMYEAGTFNTFAEPIATTNVTLNAIRDHIVAKDVWQTVQASEPGQEYSQDYAEGFKCGYADFLRDGGITIPPAMPPYRYWGRRYEYPEGRAAVDDWYAGYQRGAKLAHDSPLRELAVVPTIAILPPSKDTVRIADVDYSGTKANDSAKILGNPTQATPAPAPSK